MGYKSPKMMGFQFHITHDNNDTIELAATGDKQIIEYTDSVLSYNNKIGDIGVRAHLGYNMASGSEAEGETQMTGAAKVSVMGFDLAAVYTKVDYDVSTPGDDFEKTKIFTALTYNMSKDCKVAVTYATSEGKLTETSGSQKDEATQISLGMIHTISKNITLDVTASQYEFKGDNVNGGEKLDKPLLASAGIKLLF